MFIHLAPAQVAWVSAKQREKDRDRNRDGGVLTGWVLVGAGWALAATRRRVLVSAGASGCWVGAGWSLNRH